MGARRSTLVSGGGEEEASMQQDAGHFTLALHCSQQPRSRKANNAAILHLL